MSFMEKFRLDGKVAIITGIGPTNGQTFARALAEAGAKVCLVARSTAVTDLLVEEIIDAGGAAIRLQADLTDPGSAPRIVRECCDAFGRVDILFSHSGGVGPLVDIYDVDDSDWDTVLRMNLHSAFYLTKAASKAMICGGHGGSIVYTSSTASVMTPPRLTSYSVAKAAVSQLARCAQLNSRRMAYASTPSCLARSKTQAPALDVSQKAIRSGGLRKRHWPASARLMRRGRPRYFWLRTPAHTLRGLFCA
jgi:NAD(P)-dependent dehydrogenase (short-subunit alcohol dehydrogenase family)